MKTVAHRSGMSYQQRRRAATCSMAKAAWHGSIKQHRGMAA